MASMTVAGPLIQSPPAKKPFTIVTVDKGWSYPDFIRITNLFPNARKIIMTKGIVEIPPHKGVEVIPYDASLSMLLAEADAALFPKVGVTTKGDLLRIMKAGVPCVVHQDFSMGMVEHMKNGFIYQIIQWAQSWLGQVRDNPDWRKTIESYQWPKPEGEGPSANPKVETSTPPQKDASSQPPSQPPKVEEPASPFPPPFLGKPINVRVTVVTPTWNRDPKIIKRCIDAVRLQTFGDWEQLVCSNGPEEPHAKALVEGLGDHRIKYRHLAKLASKKDFGNSARRAMIAEAKGEFVVFCDDDNIFLPNFMEEMMSRLVNAPDSAFAVCDIMHFGPLTEKEVGPPPIILKGEPVKLYHVDPLQFMVRTKVMQEVGWDTEVGYLSDGVTLENLGKGRKYVKVNQLLAIHL
jgi:hypothetical protein